MKITTFNPMIISSKADEVVKLFEAFGFEKTHMKRGVDRQDTSNSRMKSPGGFHVDVASAGEVPRDITVIRINVDNFDEAHDFFLRRGFTDAEGGSFDTDSSKYAFMISTSGFGIDLVQHIK